MNKSPQYSQEAEPEQFNSKLKEIHLSKPRNWSSVSENTSAMQ